MPNTTHPSTISYYQPDTSDDQLGSNANSLQSQINQATSQLESPKKSIPISDKKQPKTTSANLKYPTPPINQKNTNQLTSYFSSPKKDKIQNPLPNLTTEELSHIQETPHIQSSKSIKHSSIQPIIKYSLMGLMMLILGLVIGLLVTQLF